MGETSSSDKLIRECESQGGLSFSGASICESQYVVVKVSGASIIVERNISLRGNQRHPKYKKQMTRSCTVCNEQKGKRKFNFENSTCILCAEKVKVSESKIVKILNKD